MKCKFVLKFQLNRQFPVNYLIMQKTEIRKGNTYSATYTVHPKITLLIFPHQQVKGILNYSRERGKVEKNENAFLRVYIIF